MAEQKEEIFKEFNLDEYLKEKGKYYEKDIKFCQEMEKMPIDISFEQTDETLQVYITTENLYAEPITNSEEDINRYHSLIGNPEVMAKYADRKPRTKEQAQARVEELNNRWTGKGKYNSPYPYSGFFVYDKENDEFKLATIIGDGTEAGHAELAYIGKPKTWQEREIERTKGKTRTTSEIVYGVANNYADTLKDKKYKIQNHELTHVGDVVAEDNIPSIRVSISAGLKYTGEKKEIYEDHISRCIFKKQVGSSAPKI